MMKTIFRYIMFVVLSLFLTGCDDDALMPTSADGQDVISSSKSNNTVDSYKATGDVEVTFVSNPGGHGNGNENILKEGSQKFANVVFNAHEGNLNKEAKGNIEITMKSKEGLVKRIFFANVYEVKVDPLTKEARFLALVISDIRSDEGHSDHGDTEEEHTGQGGMNGGNHTDGDHTDGDDTHDDSDHGGGCGSDDEEHGNQSRIGHTIGVKVYDDDSPGTNGDTIGWKWYGGNNPNIPSLDNNGGWAEMCLKEIIEGNLVVHVK